MPMCGLNKQSILQKGTAPSDIYPEIHMSPVRTKHSKDLKMSFKKLSKGTNVLMEFLYALCVTQFNCGYTVMSNTAIIMSNTAKIICKYCSCFHL